MRIINSCVVQQDSILQTVVCVKQPSRTRSVFYCSYSTRP